MMRWIYVCVVRPSFLFGAILWAKVCQPEGNRKQERNRSKAAAGSTTPENLLEQVFPPLKTSPGTAPSLVGWFWWSWDRHWQLVPGRFSSVVHLVSVLQWRTILNRDSL